MKYNLNVKIIPKEHYIKVEGNIQDIEHENGVSQFYLNENFKISKLSCKGNDVEYIHDKDAPRPLYDLISRPVILKTPVNGELEFEYEGCIPEITNDINQIDEDIVELAIYSGWFPKNLIDKDFEFKVIVELPAEYILSANGKITEVESDKSKKIYAIDSYGEGIDIVLFASNKVVNCEKSADGVSIRCVCPPNMKNFMIQKIDALIEAQRRVSSLLGKIAEEYSMCFTYRPRGGWGYGRGSLVMMPGGDGDEEMIMTGSPADHIGGDLHELAHSWWCIASFDTEDWINEGGAEYTMISTLKDMLGHEDYFELIGKLEYIKHITELESDFAISETRTDEWDARYVNRYEKTAIMYIGAELRFGKANLFKFLREFYEQNKIGRNATTERFLDLCEKIMGKEAREYFNWLLSAKGWGNIDINEEILK